MRLLLFISFLLATGYALGQSPAVVWGDDIRIENKERYIDIVGQDASSFYTVKDLFGTNTEFVFEKYNRDDVQRQFSKTIRLPELGRQKMAYKTVYMINEQIYLFTTLDNKDTDTYQVYCTLLTSAGDYADIPKLLSDLGSRNRHGSEFEIELSADSTKFLIYHDAPFERLRNEAFLFSVYDMNLELIWSKKLELPYAHDVFQINEFRLDQAGNLYMLSGVSHEKVKDERTWRAVRKQDYILISYDWAQNKVTEFAVELDNKWVISVTCGIAPSGDLAIGGFYSNDQYFSIAGTFYFRLDAQTRAIKAQGMMAFDRHFLGQFMSEKRVERGQELSNFYFDYFVLREDGTALMVAEQFYVSEHVAPDPTTNQAVITYFYNYNDIIAIDIAADGVIRWAKRIPKEQSTSNDGGAYSSYSLVDLGDRVVVIFNDNPGNTALLAENPKADPYRFSNIKKSMGVMVSLSKDGELSRKSLFSQKDADTILRPKLISRAGDSLIIYGQYKRFYRFGRVDLH